MAIDYATLTDNEKLFVAQALHASVRDLQTGSAAAWVKPWTQTPYSTETNAVKAEHWYYAQESLLYVAKLLENLRAGAAKAQSYLTANVAKDPNGVRDDIDELFKVTP